MIYFIIGLIVGAIAVYLILKNCKKAASITSSSEKTAVDKDLAQKQENQEKIKDYIQDKDKFTNDDLQAFLKVSDTTIGRYLEELEKAKVIKQIGKTGHSVYYVKS